MNYIKTTFPLLVTTFYSMFSIPCNMDLCYLYNFSEEKLFYVLLLSIDHYNRKNYVASRFSPT